MRDENKIVAICGGQLGHITAPGKPVSEVIDVLESALALVKSGELVAVGLALVTDHAGNVDMNSDFAFRSQTSSDLYVATELLRQRLMDRFRA